MARNYMRDITPPSEEPEKRAPRVMRFTEEEEEAPERSIRDIRPSAARARLTMRPPEYADEPRMPYGTPQKRRGIGVWIAVAALVVVIGGAGILFLYPTTSVTVVPRTQVVTFDASMPFTAYPEADAAQGTIAYRVVQQSFDDSAVVQASGMEHVEEQAKGKITVYNGTDKTVALIKNTRFQTPDGRIFRIPNSIEVPAAGSLETDVFADQTGDEYNVGPFEKLTVPGLKSSADIYEKVYAKSTAAFTGGFSGERPAVTESVLQAAQAEVRGRLQEKANQVAQTAPEGTIAFPGLIAVSFETLPPTEEGGGNVRLNERATVSVPVFPLERFAGTVAQTVSANAEGQSVRMQLSGVTGTPAAPLSAADLGKQSFAFTLSGRGLLVWNVDSEALTAALKGRDEAAFETIVAGFPAIEEARARIMPFWKSSFPEGNIRVTVEEPPQS